MALIAFRAALNFARLEMVVAIAPYYADLYLRRFCAGVVLVISSSLTSPVALIYEQKLMSTDTSEY